MSEKRSFDKQVFDALAYGIYPDATLAKETLTDEDQMFLGSDEAIKGAICDFLFAGQPESDELAACETLDDYYRSDCTIGDEYVPDDSKERLEMAYHVGETLGIAVAHYLTFRVWVSYVDSLLPTITVEEARRIATEIQQAQ